MKSLFNPRHAALFLVVMGLGVAILFPLREIKQRTVCQSSLKQIGLATMQYTRDYDEKWMFAPKWKEALAPYGKFYRAPLVYSCPKTALGYAYNIHFGGNRLAAVPNPATIPLFYEPTKGTNADGGQQWATQGIHSDGSNVGFADGHVQWLRTRPIFWTPQLENKTRVLARRATLDQANEWHEYRVYLQKLKQRKSKP